jgi:hypothetical protein
VVPIARGLSVLRVPEQPAVAFMRYDMVDQCRGLDTVERQAPDAERMQLLLVRCDLVPSRRVALLSRRATAFQIFRLCVLTGLACAGVRNVDGRDGMSCTVGEAAIRDEASLCARRSHDRLHHQRDGLRFM